MVVSVEDLRRFQGSSLSRKSTFFRRHLQPSIRHLHDNDNDEIPLLERLLQIALIAFGISSKSDEYVTNDLQSRQILYLLRTKPSLADRRPNPLCTRVRVFRMREICKSFETIGPKLESWRCHGHGITSWAFRFCQCRLLKTSPANTCFPIAIKSEESDQVRMETFKDL